MNGLKMSHEKMRILLSFSIQ